MTVAVDVSDRLWQQSGLVRAAEGLALVFFLYQVIKRFIRNQSLQNIVKIVAIPILLLQVFGLLEPVIAYLEAQTIEIGNIHISA